MSRDFVMQCPACQRGGPCQTNDDLLDDAARGEYCREAHGVRCGTCGAIETIMRPGKYQCNSCDYWQAAIANALGFEIYDDHGWHDPMEELRRIRTLLGNEKSEDKD